MLWKREKDVLDKGGRNNSNIKKKTLKGLPWWLSG